MRLLSICTAMVSGLLLAGLVSGPAYAGHETRTTVLHDTGTDVVFFVLVVLTISAATLALVAFAAIIHRLERGDEEEERRRVQRHAGEPRK
jgi:uncharacterized protein HemY